MVELGIFYIFAIALVVSGLMVITTRNPVAGRFSTTRHTVIDPRKSICKKPRRESAGSTFNFPSID